MEIFFLECLLCKIQDFKVLETFLHIRLNNYRKDIKLPNATEAFKYFENWSQVFHKHGKLILIEQLNNINNASTEVLKQSQQDRESYR